MYYQNSCMQFDGPKYWKNIWKFLAIVRFFSKNIVQITHASIYFSTDKNFGLSQRSLPENKLLKEMQKFRNIINNVLHQNQLWKEIICKNE